MIHLKNKLNKTATLKQLREEAEKGYENSYEPELQVEAFMKGAETLLNLLHLPRVSGSYSIEDELKDKIDKGLIDDKLEPIKCECGSTNFNDQTRDMLNYEVVKKDRYCGKCGKLVGYWSYGHWLP